MNGDHIRTVRQVSHALLDCGAALVGRCIISKHDMGISVTINTMHKGYPGQFSTTVDSVDRAVLVANVLAQKESDNGTK